MKMPRKQMNPKPVRPPQEDTEELCDHLVCGLCSEEFNLSEIVMFMKHKIICNVDKVIEIDDDTATTTTGSDIGKEYEAVSDTDEQTVKTEYETNNYVCVPCGEVFSGTRDLFEHIHYTHGIKISFRRFGEGAKSAVNDFFTRKERKNGEKINKISLALHAANEGKGQEYYNEQTFVNGDRHLISMLPHLVNYDEEQPVQMVLNGFCNSSGLRQSLQVKNENMEMENADSPHGMSTSTGSSRQATPDSGGGGGGGEGGGVPLDSGMQHVKQMVQKQYKDQPNPDSTKESHDVGKENTFANEKCSSTVGLRALDTGAHAILPGFTPYQDGIHTSIAYTQSNNSFIRNHLHKSLPNPFQIPYPSTFQSSGGFIPPPVPLPGMPPFLLIPQVNDGLSKLPPVSFTSGMVTSSAPGPMLNMVSGSKMATNHSADVSLPHLVDSNMKPMQIKHESLTKMTAPGKPKMPSIRCCPHCNYKTMDSSNFRRHLRKHTGERPYKCSHCPYECNQTVSLKAHLKRRHDTEFYKCKYCDKEFLHMIVLHEHCKTDHAEEYRNQKRKRQQYRRFVLKV